MGQRPSHTPQVCACLLGRTGTRREAALILTQADTARRKAHSKQHAGQKHAQRMAPSQPSPLAWPQQARPMLSGLGREGLSAGPASAQVDATSASSVRGLARLTVAALVVGAPRIMSLPGSRVRVRVSALNPKIPRPRLQALRWTR